MATATIKYFDTHEFVKKSKELGASEQLAEYQVKQIEQAIEIAVAQIEGKELANKQDVQLAIAQLKTELIKWMIGIGFITITSISGVIFTLLKLMIH